MRIRRASLISIGVLLALAGTGESGAEAAKGGADAAVKQAMQQLAKAKGLLNQLTQEKETLAKEKADVENKLKAAEERVKQLEPLLPLQALPAQLQKFQAALEESQKNNATLRQRISDDAERMRQMAERHQGTMGDMRRVQQDNRLLVNAVKERTDWIGQCAGRNRHLIEANLDMLDKFSKRGFWESVAEAEPLTGIGAVDKQNAVDEYRYRLEDLQVTPWRDDSAKSEKAAPQESELSDPAAGNTPAESTADAAANTGIDAPTSDTPRQAPAAPRR